MIRRNQKRRLPKSSSKGKVPLTHRRELVLAAGVIFVGVWLFEGTGILDYVRMTSELTRMQQDISELQRVNQSLAQEIQAIETNPLALEKLARERLGYVRKGETVYQLVETPHTTEERE